MKKFLITLFILLILGGVGFFFGWVQLTVPPDAFGVIISKTHGVDPHVVRAGEFRWLWYKLIPTNVNIPVFRLRPHNFNIDFNSSLPSGAHYAAFASPFLGQDVDFSWQLRAAASVRLSPDKLVDLVRQQTIGNQEDLDAYIRNMALRIEGIILRSLTSMDMDTERLERILGGQADEQINREIERQFPHLEYFSLVVQYARFPDFALYREVRFLYEEFLARQREIIADGFAERAEHHIAAHLHFDELRRYGELLTQFPILLDFLVLDISRGPIQ